MPLALRPGTVPDFADFRAYPLDLCRRRDPVTGAHLVTATFLAGDYTGPSNARAFIDGTRQWRSHWSRAAGVAADPAAIFEVQVDLGAVFRIGGVGMAWISYWAPTTVLVDGSLDGLTWMELSPAIDYRQKIFNARTLASPDVRHLRLVCVGTRFGIVMPKSLTVFPSWDNLPALGLPGLNAIAGCPDAAWTVESPANWDAFNLWPLVFDVEQARGRVGAAGDATAVLDLGQVASINGLVLGFGNRDDGQAGVWEHGAAVEVRTGGSDPWTEVANVNGPIDLEDPAPLMFGGTVEARQVRLINRRGTYGSGHPAEGQPGTGTGPIGVVELIGAGTDYAPRALMRVNVPGPRSLSAAIYDGIGRLRQTIAPGATITGARSVEVPWSGTDREGETLPDGLYTAKTLHVPAVHMIAAFVGNSGNPGEPFTPFLSISKSAMSSPAGVAVSPDGQTVALVGLFSEDANRLQAMTIDGVRLWTANPQRYTFCGATDGTDLWVASNKGEHTLGSAVERRVLATGAYHNADDSTSDPDSSGDNARFAVSAPTPDPEPTRSRRSRDGARDADPITALAVEVSGPRLFVANHAENRVEVWNKDLSGAISETGLALTNPTGLAIDPLGRGLWVAHTNNQVQLVPYSGSGPTFATPTATIGSLNDPCGLGAIDRGSGSIRLFVAEAGRNRVREFEVSDLGAIAGAGTFADFGADHAPGPLLDSRFAWTPMVASGHVPQLGAVAGGGLVVVDPGNGGTIRFDAAGARVWRTFRLHEPSPEFDLATINDPVVRLTCGSFVYEVKLDGTTFTDGLGEGNWRVAANLMPSDGAFVAPQNMTPLVVRHLDVNRFNEDPPDVRTFYFQHRGDQPLQRSLIVLMDPGGGSPPRRTTIVGSGWSGLDDTLKGVPAAWTWVDADGDGLIDATDPLLDGANGEILDFLAGWHLFGESNSVRIAANGDIWIANCVWYGGPSFPENVVRLPVSDFNAQGSPVYRLADLEVIVVRSTLKGLDGVTPHAQGDLQLEDSGGFVLMTRGTDGVLFRRFDASFQEVAAWPAAIETGQEQERAAAIQGDTAGWFVEAGGGPLGFSRVMVRDADGMVLAYASPDDAHYEGNWNDHVYGVTAAKLAGGDILVAVEHNFAGAIPMIRFSGLDNPIRSASTFAWAGPEAWAALPPRTFNFRRLRLAR